MTPIIIWRGTAHAYPATGRMVKTPRLLARRGCRRARPMGRARRPDRRRRKGRLSAGDGGAGPEHIVRLTWYLTSRGEYEAAAPGIGAAWKETLGRNFPPSTLLYIGGLVDVRAKVEIEVTAYVPKA